MATIISRFEKGYTPWNKELTGYSKPQKRRDVSRRFWSKVQYDQDITKCWEWTAGCDHAGYGVFGIWEGDRTLHIGAHRFAFTRANGPISEGLFVMHKCDNPKCCNPSHLQAGTAQENTLDMVSKVRHFQQKKTHCKRGHAFTDDNIYQRGKRWRECLTCKRMRDAEYHSTKQSKR